MRAALPVRALVARCELPFEDLVRDLLRILRERIVDLAAVDQQRRLRLLEIFLHNVRSQPTHSIVSELDSVKPHLEILGDPEARRVRNDRNFAPTLEREPPDGRGPKAIARRPNPSDTLSLERLDDRVHDRLPALGSVPRHPSLAVEVCAGHDVFRERLALEEIRHDRAVSVPCKVIDEELLES